MTHSQGASWFLFTEYQRRLVVPSAVKIQKGHCGFQKGPGTIKRGQYPKLQVGFPVADVKYVEAAN
jgi:hypothetical protein